MTTREVSIVKRFSIVFQRGAEQSVSLHSDQSQDEMVEVGYFEYFFISFIMTTREGFTFKRYSIAFQTGAEQSVSLHSDQSQDEMVDVGYLEYFYQFVL